MVLYLPDQWVAGATSFFCTLFFTKRRIELYWYILLFPLFCVTLGEIKLAVENGEMSFSIEELKSHNYWLGIRRDV
uniref:Uncharacterized protein n=1 Tax=Solanum lycopersicum TaxID=4081 RepID=A0A3Q7G4X7_SOLLC